MLRRPEPRARGPLWIAARASFVLLLGPVPAAGDSPSEVLTDRCRMACRTEQTPRDVCTARCPCTVQGFQQGLSAADLPRWIAALDQQAPASKPARERWDGAAKRCGELQAKGALY